MICPRSSALVRHGEPFLAGTCKLRIVLVDGGCIDNQFNVICDIGSALANADSGAKALQMGSQFRLSGV